MVLQINRISNGDDFLNTMEAYNPATNAWSTKAPMPTARSAAAAVASDGIIYAMGGSNGDELLNTIEAYNPATNAWSTKAPMPTARGAAAAVASDGIIYAMGGISNGDVYLDSVEAYDPVADAWSSSASMPAARAAPIGAEVNGVIYAAGGASTSGVVATNEAFTAAGGCALRARNAGDLCSASDATCQAGITLTCIVDTALPSPGAITTDMEKLFVADSHSIFSVPIVGGDAKPVYELGDVAVSGLTLIGSELYWIDPNGDPDATAIFKGPKSGNSEPTKIYSGFATGQPIVDGVGITTNVEGDKLFTSDAVQGRGSTA